MLSWTFECALECTRYAGAAVRYDKLHAVTVVIPQFALDVR